MKELDVTWGKGIFDPTGYLFSYAKSFGTLFKNSPYFKYAEDSIATSGFAFRMWVDEKTLCPSAMSMWDFALQRVGAENSGYTCEYISRLWGEDAVEEERRLQALDAIRRTIDNGIPAVSWDVGNCEWGLVTGYDDEAKLLRCLIISGAKADLPYDKLGKNELPILSVLTITGKTEKNAEAVYQDTLKTAVSHLRGEEWCENVKGLDAYPALIKFINDQYAPDSWSITYYLGTYAGLKYYAWKYFEKQRNTDLSNLYKNIYGGWKTAFALQQSNSEKNPAIGEKIIDSLNTAYENEKAALNLMMSLI